MDVSLLLVFVFTAGVDGLHVHGPSGPVLAQLQGSVHLPCFSESPLPLAGLQVEWRKVDSDSVVSLFQQGESEPDLQSQEFRRRADFFLDEIFKGNFSILLKNVTEKDAGIYKCQVTTSHISSEVTMEITFVKHLVVRGADRPVFAHEGEDVILNCSVDSHVPVSEIEEVTWKKPDQDQDILVLLYQFSEVFPESSHERYQGRVDLFPSEIPKGNFSLKLMGVMIEDKGEFMCEVHMRNMSAHSIVLLQDVGFSALHITILVLCVVSLLLAIGLCGPVFNRLRNKDASNKPMKMHISLILCPNICIFVAFCLWSKEGFLAEVITCSTISIIRPIMLLKTSLYIGRLPQFLQKTVKTLAVPLYHLTVIVSACSFILVKLAQTEDQRSPFLLGLAGLAVVFVIIAVVLGVFGFRIQLTVSLEIINGVFFGFILNTNRASLNYVYEMIAVVPSLMMALLMVLSLQRHILEGKPFRCVHIVLSSAILTVMGLYEISSYIFFSMMINNFVKGWILIFMAVMYILAWLGVVYLVRCHHRLRCCNQWKKIGYSCCLGIVALLFITLGMVFFYYVIIIIEDKERAGYLALAALVHVLAALCLFKHPKNLPNLLHIVVYIFGAVGLSIISATVLSTELILKAGKGSRAIGDLRGTVLSFEAVFVAAWLVLQIYDAWMRLRDKINHNFKDRSSTGPKEPQEGQEIEMSTSFLNEMKD